MQHSRLRTHRSASPTAATTSGANSDAVGTARRRSATPRPNIVSPASASFMPGSPAAGQRDTVGPRAKLKKELASGEIELAQILAEPPECVQTARMRDVLLALPKIGSVKAGRILADCGIAPR